MKITNLRKETSERSDASNWVKKILISNTPLYYDSIEGCNQNTDNKVTHLFERARIDEKEGKTSLKELASEIIKIEGEKTLIRKINFAKKFGINLSYILYCDETENVYRFEFEDIKSFNYIEKYNSYKAFSDWIATIKVWKSSKSFREYDDLPYFDKELRKHKTPWPTNIDCFISNEDNEPIGIIEFQNAKDTGVLSHCNNDYFQCKISYTREGYYGPYTVYSDDIRRWTSQEILRVQSGLRLFIITWSQNSDDFILKELHSVAIPYFPKKDGKIVWGKMAHYKKALHNYVNSGRKKEYEEVIANNAKTYNLIKKDDAIDTIINEPKLYYEKKTFPSLYYKSKTNSTVNKDLINSFLNLLEK